MVFRMSFDMHVYMFVKRPSAKISIKSMASNCRLLGVLQCRLDVNIVVAYCVAGHCVVLQSILYHQQEIMQQCNDIFVPCGNVIVYTMAVSELSTSTSSTMIRTVATHPV